MKVLLYNLIGEHAAVVAEEKARRNADQTEENKIDYLYNLLLQIGESVLANDRRGLLTSSTNIFKTLLRPFVEMDNRSSGKLLLEEFAEVLNNLGSAIAVDDLTFLGSVYGIEDENQPLYASNSGDYVSTLRDRMLSGSLSGAAKANPTFGSWVAKTGIGLAGPANRTVVDYIAFSEKLAEVLERLIHQKNGVEIGIGSKYPWVLKEYDLIDTLICQLEEMTPSQRRRTLMSLQYALSAADHTQKGDLDGFAVLDCLLNCGFKLQRINRVRLLRAVEELGGRMNYRELCEILLNSCADWTAEERALVKHILASMGVTVIERRGWLARLRQNLMEAQSKIDRRTTKWFTDTTILGTTNSSNAQEIGIPPASFLHCLRDCGVKLSVDEEATLLDCLDTERLARESARNYSSNTAAQHIKDSWSIPMVQYESFLQFCARHCGNWYDASPEVNASLAEAVGRVSSPLLALHEFASVLATFDETDTGVISQRAFEICCNRSRLLANMSDKAIAELAEVLAVDGGGSINYSNFIVYVRTICSDSLKSTTDKSKPSIVNQLIHNATDRNGTILPLRKWILANTDIQSFVLTQRDMSTMLREFNVIYRPEDLDNLYMEIGKHVENQKFQNTRDNNVLSEISSKKGFADSLLEEEIDQVDLNTFIFMF